MKGQELSLLRCLHRHLPLTKRLKYLSAFSLLVLLLIPVVYLTLTWNMREPLKLEAVRLCKIGARQLPAARHEKCAETQPSMRPCLP